MTLPKRDRRRTPRTIERSHYYILVGREPQPCDVLTWGFWFEEHKRDDVRIVRQESAGRGWFVSTVFLGLDHQWRDVGPPLLFETLVMGPRRVRRELREYRDLMRRYSTWDDAAAGHRAIVAMLYAALAVARGEGALTMTPDTAGQVLITIAAALSAMACLLSVRLARRARRAIDDTITIKEQFGRAVGFAAFCTTKESGAPAPLRKMAREALPPGTAVLITRDDGEEQVH